MVARSRAFLEAQVASRSLTPQAGVGPTRCCRAWRTGCAATTSTGALAEAAALPTEAPAAMAGWLAAARLRAGAVAGLAALDGALAATN